MKLETPGDDEIETVEFNDSDTETIDTNEASTSGQSTAIVSGTEVAQFNAAGEFLPLHEPKRFFFLGKKLFNFLLQSPEKNRLRSNALLACDLSYEFRGFSSVEVEVVSLMVDDVACVWNLRGCL